MTYYKMSHVDHRISSVEQRIASDIPRFSIEMSDLVQENLSAVFDGLLYTWRLCSYASPKYAFAVLVTFYLFIISQFFYSCISLSPTSSEHFLTENLSSKYLVCVRSWYYLLFYAYYSSFVRMACLCVWLPRAAVYAVLNYWSLMTLNAFFLFQRELLVFGSVVCHPFAGLCDRSRGYHSGVVSTIWKAYVDRTTVGGRVSPTTLALTDSFREHCVLWRPRQRSFHHHSTIQVISL